ncbi:hypothetical protein LUX39_08000 [Actinomadura madurae]|nr:thiolase family protein [Actinomadura madurae]MCP9948292.1 hypothetical protein [Actinomadura madurae]MCP9965066.1 hypothetical protein [Actinomadura madurae]MCQ0013739.1 hypothetical protein [Actinomadura madurae]
MGNVHLLGGLRTPFARRKGALADAHPAELLGTLTKNTLTSVGVAPEDVDQVITGCVTKTGDQANSIGRTAWLTAGLPSEVPGTTVDARCGSSQQAAHYGAGLIASGAVDVVVANGVEHMTRHPLGQDVGEGMGDPLSPRYCDLYEVTSQGESAERIADHWKQDRVRCDELALASQERARDAIASGRLAIEIDPVGEFATDSGPRESTMEGLGALRTVFRSDGVLTAGNSSQITDGASCVVLVSESFAAEHGLTPLAQVEHQTLVGVDPVWKLTGPMPPPRRSLSAAGCARPTSGPPRSTRRSPVSSAPGWRRSASRTSGRTSMAAPSPSGTRSARPARGCCSPQRTNSAEAVTIVPWSRCAAAAVWAPRRS